MKDTVNYLQKILNFVSDESVVAWETHGGDVELSGVFHVSLCGENFDSCHVDFLLKTKGTKVKAAGLVQSTLLGLNMAISTTVETRPVDLADEFQFLKKI
jgi:hypothetical protein